MRLGAGVNSMGGSASPRYDLPERRAFRAPLQIAANGGTRVVMTGSDRLGGRQVAFNVTSRDQWEGFADHRRYLMRTLVRGAMRGRSRLCILGAGNANDLDLPALLDAYREVHLVDIDAEALALGAMRQAVAGHTRLRLHGGVDVTATLGVLSDWSPTSELTLGDFEALAAWPASRVANILPRGFDRVASTCVLSQILETAANALGLNHLQLAEAETALLNGHLRLMAGLAAPEGEASLVAEVVSSATCSNLADLSDKQLIATLPELIRQRNHFRGTHPQQLLSALRDEPTVGSLVQAASLLSPWRWRLHHRTYLVGGIRFALQPQ
jgi:hypothetical protein